MKSDLKRFGQRVRELRQTAGLTQEELAERSGLHRTYIGGIERGERNVGVLNLLQLARALRVRPGDLVTWSRVPRRPMARTYSDEFLKHQPSLDEFGLSVDMIGRSVGYVYEILDSIDAKLVDGGGERLAKLLELANLSAIIGNLYRAGVVRNCDGRFVANTPHTYPDLVSQRDECSHLEIKVALETNKPKGHLIKPGPHVIVRYVLCDEHGNYVRGKENRGAVPWIWEIRVGTLTDAHFSVSNTDGDSGKTAVVTAEGMEALHVVYRDPGRSPMRPRGRKVRSRV